MGGTETKGTQFRSDLPDAHQGYPVVTAGASSSRSGGGRRVRRYREDDGEKEVRWQDERVMRPQSGKKYNGRGERVRGLKSGEEGA